MAVDFRVREALDERMFQIISHIAQVIHGFLKILPHESAGFTQANDFDHIFRSGPQIPLMIGAVNQLFQSNAAADVQRSDALGRVQFMSGYRKQIDT